MVRKIVCNLNNWIIFMYLVDFFRWICDGKLSANQPEKFVPDFDRHVKKNDLVSVNRNGFQESMKNFTLNMDFCDIPAPNLLKLADRYCTDFHLPS